MSDDAETARGPFDVEQLRELFQMMETHGLTEVSLKHGETQWRLRRGGAEPVAVVSPATPVVAAPAPVAAAGTPAEAAPAAETASGVFVKSPTVGTFYSAPSPDDPPFVKVGDRVSADSVVCIVEAMKVMNQIQAEVSGVIVEVLVQNGDAVEFNQPLFRVEP